MDARCELLLGAAPPRVAPGRGAGLLGDPGELVKSCGRLVQQPPYRERFAPRLGVQPLGGVPAALVHQAERLAECLRSLNEGRAQLLLLCHSRFLLLAREGRTLELLGSWVEYQRPRVYCQAPRDGYRVKLRARCGLKLLAWCRPRCVGLVKLWPGSCSMRPELLERASFVAPGARVWPKLCQVCGTGSGLNVPAVWHQARELLERPR